MRRSLAIMLAVLAFISLSFAQNDPPTFKAKAASAFVWEEDDSSGTVSSNIRDPVTGNPIHKLSHGGIEVSSRAGFESIGSGEAGELLTFTTTIVNNTDSELSVRSGGASFDGHMALPLSVVVSKKRIGKKDRAQTWELARIHCFTRGDFPIQIFFSRPPSSDAFIVRPKKALTVSFVTKDPRNYSVLCSLQGCYPKGMIRFSITVDATDFVFVWPGRDVAYCGGR